MLGGPICAAHVRQHIRCVLEYLVYKHKKKSKCCYTIHRTSDHGKSISRDFNIRTLAPNLRGLLTIPSERENIFSHWQIWHSNFVNDLIVHRLEANVLIVRGLAHITASPSVAGAVAPQSWNW